MNFLHVIIILLLSKLFIGIWVYKDAKSRGIDPIIWTLLILFFSGSLIFLLYVLVVRKERNTICDNCNFTQPKDFIYCGRCGNKIKIDRYSEGENNGNRIFLVIGIILLTLSIVLGSILTYNMISRDIDNIPISIMSFSTKYNNKWKESFKYKNGEKTHKFTIKDKDILNCSWEIDKGNIQVELLEDDKVIRKLSSNDNSDYKELIDLSDYKGSKIVLRLKSKKASGKIHFFLE